MALEGLGQVSEEDPRWLREGVSGLGLLECSYAAASLKWARPGVEPSVSFAFLAVTPRRGGVRQVLRGLATGHQPCGGCKGLAAGGCG